MGRWVIASLLVLGAACGKGGSGAGGTGTGMGTGSVGNAPSPGVDAAPMMDASTEAVDTSAPAKDWWKQGVAACPKGGQIDGEPPPGGTHVFCKRADGVSEGPEAWWDDKGNLLSIGANKEGRRSGLFTAFYADGSKHREGSYRAGNQHGPQKTWWPNGQLFLDEKYVDGRADGEQIAYAQDGKVIARWTLKMGTGTMTYWDDEGHKSGETGYVDGRAQGASTSYYPSGKVQTKERFIDGDVDGPSVDFWENGQPRERGTYARGNQVGDWSTFDEHGAQTLLVRRDRDGEVFELLYQDGQPLVPMPKATACDDKAGLERVAFGAAKRGDDPECLERPRNFPGVAVAGQFAYDAGCMSPRSWIIDCEKVAEPGAPALLARAGWARAKGKVREALAMAYVEQIDMMWSGSIQSEPDAAKALAAADGSVVVTAWTAPRSGMREDLSIALRQWTFTPGGAVTDKTIKTGTRAR